MATGTNTIVDLLLELGDGIARIEAKLDSLRRAETRRAEMAQADIDRLKAAVTRIEEAGPAVVALITGLAQQIRDAADDPAELQSLSERLETQAQALADAALSNTPATP